MKYVFALCLAFLFLVGCSEQETTPTINEIPNAAEWTLTSTNDTLNKVSIITTKIVVKRSNQIIRSVVYNDTVPMLGLDSNKVAEKYPFFVTVN
jgi:uncharacterized protein YcfL